VRFRHRQLAHLTQISRLPYAQQVRQSVLRNLVSLLQQREGSLCLSHAPVILRPVPRSRTLLAVRQLCPGMTITLDESGHPNVESLYRDHHAV
jgi:hypothetical protein